MKVLLIIVIGYYLLKYILRLAFPIVVKKYMHNMEEKFRNQQGHQKQEDLNIGETVVDKKPNAKTSNDSVGEYVDFEEVE